MEPAFWIVWNPDGKKPPSEMHKTHSGAMKAAKSLARKTGEIFYVLRAECCFQQQVEMACFHFQGYGQPRL